MADTPSKRPRRLARPRSTARRSRPTVAPPALHVPKVSVPKVSVPKVNVPKVNVPKVASVPRATAAPATGTARRAGRRAAGAAKTAAAAATPAPKSASRRRKRRPVVTVIRLAFVPVRLAAFVLGLGAKVGYRAGRISAKGGRAVARRAGWGRVALLGTGVLIGLLISAVPGRSMRAALRKAFGGGSGGGSLAERVAAELAHSPRTWHLTQPEVTADGGVVTLRGTVAHATARDALERTARSVPGVTEVVSELTAG